MELKIRDTKMSQFHFAGPPRWDVKTQGVAFEPLKGVRSGDTMRV